MSTPAAHPLTFPGRSDRAIAVIVARHGRLPIGADDVVAEAGGLAVVVGSGTEAASRMLVAAERAWWCETGAGYQPGALAARVAPAVADFCLVVLPASADGRDLGPRLAATLGRPLIAQAQSVAVAAGNDLQPGGVVARVARLDDQVLISVAVDGAAVATLIPGSRSVSPLPAPAVVEPLELSPPDGAPVGDPVLIELVEPDPATMDLADAARVVGGGAGLVAGLPDDQAIATFDLLVEVSAALGASAGATRVATDAGWTGYERQIGTTGVSIDPDLYIALGLSGATQHVGGLGAPRHVVSVNTDPSCPMTAMADLGLVTDARALLEELARRFGVATPGRPAPAADQEVAHRV